MAGEPLLPAPLVVRGHLVAFDDARPQIPDGVVYVDRDGLILALASVDEQALRASRAQTSSRRARSSTRG